MNPDSQDMARSAIAVAAFAFLFVSAWLYERNRFRQCPRCKTLHTRAGLTISSNDPDWGYLDGQCQTLLCHHCTNRYSPTRTTTTK